MRFRERSDPPTFTKQRNNGTVSRMTNSFSFARTCLALALQVPHPGKHLCHGKQGQRVTRPELKPRSVWLQSPFSPPIRKEVTEAQFGLAQALLESFTLLCPFQVSQAWEVSMEPCHLLSQVLSPPPPKAVSQA